MLFRERKRTWFGLPWTFTVYRCDSDILYIESGLFNKREDEVRLYRVLDIAYKASFFQRMFGMGSIEMHTSDKTLGDFSLVNVKGAKEIKDILSNAVEECRQKNRVSTREFVNDIEDGDIF